jgi:flavin reductase (DIM6/NTAB) family NADH-FMN oxidoreductase RutF
MKKKTLPLSRVYRLLEPGPVVLVTTARKGQANIMVMSWHTMIDFEPPIVGCVISSRNYSFDTLKATRECVINIPTVDLAKKVVACGNSSGRKVDKFQAFGLTPVAATHVKPPLIDECYANLECKVVDTRMASKYNLFILEVT